MTPIIDLHCDLLGCIAYNEKYSFRSPELNCSLPQLLQGNVKLQVLAVAAITQKGSAEIGAKQVALYQNLLQEDQVGPFGTFLENSSKTHFLFGIENASALIEEDEDLSLFFTRFEKAAKQERILYISMTWNQENRFGGGNLSHVGLKKDGEALLDFLHGKNVAIDFSHTSDPLAFDILNYVEKKGWQIPLIASHSNFRAVHHNLRNLPDEIAREIIRKKGLIGINFVHRFVGKDPEAFFSHIEHGIKLGAKDVLSLGADYYGGLFDVPKELCPGKNAKPFFPEFSHSGTYPKFIAFLEKRWPRDFVKKICFENARIKIQQWLQNAAAHDQS